jgi:hypothetical protein
MWLYPVPVILSVAIWLFEWYSTGVAAFAGLLLAACGVVVFYLTRNRWKGGRAGDGDGASGVAAEEFAGS